MIKMVHKIANHFDVSAEINLAKNLFSFSLFWLWLSESYPFETTLFLNYYSGTDVVAFVLRYINLMFFVNYNCRAMKPNKVILPSWYLLTSGEAEFLGAAMAASKTSVLVFSIFVQWWTCPANALSSLTQCQTRLMHLSSPSEVHLLFVIFWVLTPLWYAYFCRWSPIILWNNLHIFLCKSTPSI